MAGTVFGIWDYIIMAGTMVASGAIGLYFRFSGGKQKTNEEYLLADRNMSIFPVAVSLMASFMSAITLLGVSAENYYNGMIFVVINLSYGLIIPTCTKFYLPVFFGLQKTSTYEYLELRFGSKIRMLTSLTYTLQMLLYNGIVLYTPALVLESVTGLNRLISILAVGLVCTFYSTLGGMKAVLFTDVLQSCLMFAALISIIVFSSISLGGFSQIFIKASEGGRINFNNFSPDPTQRHTWWSLIIGGLITNLSLNAVNHTQVQRLLTVSTLERSKLCLWWSWPFYVALSLLTCTSGLAIYAVYKDCDPLSDGKISSIDQLMPYYVVDAMTVIPGLSGLFVAGIFSASLSTVSAACNALAAVTLTDYVGRWCKVREAYIAVLTKLAACAYGLAFLGLAFLAEYLGGVLQAALTIFGAVGGPLLGVFTLGMFTTYATELGACLSLVSGMSMTLWISFGGPRPPTLKLPLSTEGCAVNGTIITPTPYDPSSYFYLYRISYMWTSAIGFIWVMVVGTIISLLWRQQQPWEKAGRTHPDPALFTPPLARFLKKQVEKEKPVMMQ
ncbi:putative sodium-dependent multivitamin transporter isoform X2 [Plodia interpunctella]|uniref:putative sodium-dependent multivitamin transporter isoform X2 n=1 Tax=Plodia interpunctella TaxID=58824 RepID=UPI0023685760|nr:putative sodium-dependent multivitamin transporter isoform X1 [Plodia interpunctella]